MSALAQSSWTPHGELHVDVIRSREPLQTHARRQRQAGHRDVPRLDLQAQALLGTQRIRERLGRARVRGREALAVLGVEQHMGPELEEDREPPGVVLAPAADLRERPHQVPAAVARPSEDRADLLDWRSTRRS
jgi:hypothetical protein